MSVSLHHVVEGPDDAPAVVLGCSLGTPLEMWDDQAPALAEQLRLIRIDTRGHGRSPVPGGPYSIADLGSDVLVLLDRLGIERASVVGLSLGGMVGMWLGVNAPERVDRLALCATSAGFRDPAAWRDRAAKVRAGGTVAVADAVLERWYTPAMESERPEAVTRLRSMLLDTPAEGYAGCCEAIADHDLHGRLFEIRAPTAVIAGAEDPVAPPDAMRADIADAIPGARMQVIEDARHLANVERSDRFTELLLAHLRPEER
ncbi:MAG: 3-oxoadipate enol-lactonase [Actinomycetota bacterium]